MDLDAPLGDLATLFDAIVEHVPPAEGDVNGSFQMLISTIDLSPYLGRLGIGKIERGTVKVGDSVALLPVETTRNAAIARVTKLFGYEGLERVELQQASSGEIVAMAGLEGVESGLTVTDVEHQEPRGGTAVEEPTVSVDCMVNKSPFAGKEGKCVTSRQVRERLFR